MDIWKILDHEITRPRLPRNGPVHNYPSEASRVSVDSVTGKPETIGKCQRAQYFRRITQMIERGIIKDPDERDIFEKSTLGATQLWKFGAAYDTEETITNIAKQAGIYIQDHVGFYIPEFNIKGELDAVFIIDDKYIGVDYKSIYGYYGEKQVFGTPTMQKMGQKGEAKEESVMQIAEYAWHWYYQTPKIEYFKIMYFSRGSAQRNEFKIHIEPIEGTDIASGRPNAHVFIDDVKQNWTIKDLLDRNDRLDKAVENREVPPREYDKQYSKEYLDALAKAGKLSKTDMTKHKNKKKIVKGDWRCSYCDFSGVCYDHNDYPIFDNVEGHYKIHNTQRDDENNIKETPIAEFPDEQKRVLSLEVSCSRDLSYYIQEDKLEETQVIITDLSTDKAIFKGLGKDYLKKPIRVWARQT